MNSSVEKGVYFPRSEKVYFGTGRRGAFVRAALRAKS